MVENNIGENELNHILKQMNEGDKLMSQFQKNGLIIFSRSKEGKSTMFYHLKGIPLQ